jgi:predicted lipid-binding transport protein (Tim44 family)
MLKSVVLALTITLVALTLCVGEAWAARIGGGRSVGTQRSMSVPSRAPGQGAPANTAIGTRTPQTVATPVATGPRPSGWQRAIGPLAGLAAGIGLTALLAHFGMGANMAGLFLVALVAIVGVFFLRRIKTGTQATHSDAALIEPMTVLQDSAYVGAYPQELSGHNFPLGFDVEVFARQAKLNFIRLQAANDACDLADLRNFTSPEIFAEVKLEIDERGGAPQRTDVVLLDANVLEVSTENSQYVASVRYSGKLREQGNGMPQAFDEIWHLTKPIDSNHGWILAGIQQVS